MPSFHQKYKSGFTVLELIVTLIISTFLIAFLAQRIPDAFKLQKIFMDKASFDEGYLIFIWQFEKDFHGADETSDFIELIFKRDLNKDMQYSSPGEYIEYMWDSSRRQIRRRSSTSGIFQFSLKRVDSFQWRKLTGIYQECYEMVLKPEISERARVTLMCR